MTQPIKRKINKLSFHQKENSAKDQKKKKTDWKKIFANHIFNKSLLHRNFQGQTVKKTNHPIRKWAKDMKMCLSQQLLPEDLKT